MREFHNVTAEVEQCIKHLLNAVLNAAQMFNSIDKGNRDEQFARYAVEPEAVIREVLVKMRQEERDAAIKEAEIRKAMQADVGMTPNSFFRPEAPPPVKKRKKKAKRKAAKRNANPNHGVLNQ